MGFNVEKSAPASDKPFAQPKKGQRAARLVGLIDLGLQPQSYMGEDKAPCKEFIPMFWLANDKYTTDEGEEKHMVRGPWPLKIYAGAKRGHYFDFCQGIDPNGEVLSDGAGDITQLLGRKCLVNITEDKKVKDGKDVSYFNIKGVGEAPEDYPIPELDIDTFTFDTSEPTKAGFEKLSERNQTTIKGSIGYEGSALQAVCEGDSAAAAKPNNDEATPESEQFDDDIPF
jgi:hypothetical protein